MVGCYDENDSLYLCPPELGTHWLSWDFGADPNERINRIRIKQHEEDWSDPWSFDSLKVQSSCDAQSWTDEWVMDNLPTDGSWAERSRPE